MFDLEYTASPWHYHVYRHRQDLFTTGQWKGKNYIYHLSHPSDEWHHACYWSNKAYVWLQGRWRPYEECGRIMIIMEHDCWDDDCANDDYLTSLIKRAAREHASLKA